MSLDDPVTKRQLLSAVVVICAAVFMVGMLVLSQIQPEPPLIPVTLAIGGYAFLSLALAIIRDGINRSIWNAMPGFEVTG